MASIEFPLSFTRQFVGPLDTSSVYDSLIDLQDYVNNNPIAYLGQVLSIASGDDAGIYIVGDDGAGGFNVEKYSNETDLSSKANSSDLTTHINDSTNPHSVTAAQVGLGSVENTALSTWPGSGAITTVGTLGSLTVSGQTTFTNNFPFLPSGTPTDSNHAVPKSYVDTLSEGLHTHDQVHALALSELSGLIDGNAGPSTVSYDNGTNGVGATLTIVSAGEFNFLSPIVWDNDPDILLTNRVLVINQGNAFENGIYEITSSTVLTRASDFDTPAEMAGGDFVFVTHGDTYNNTGWVLSEPVNTVGTDEVHFIQFSGAGSFIGGHGITINGNEVSIPKNELIELQDLTISGDFKLISDPLPPANYILTTDAAGIGTWQEPFQSTLNSVTTNGATTLNDISVGRIVTLHPTNPVNDNIASGNSSASIGGVANVVSGNGSVSYGGIGQEVKGLESSAIGGINTILNTRYTSAIGGTGSVVGLGTSLINDIDAQNSIALGGNGNIIESAQAAATVGGDTNRILTTHHRSVILGGQNIITDAADTAYVPNLNVGAGFKMPTGAIDTYVLTTDAFGVGTWQEAAGGAVSDLEYSGDWDSATNPASATTAPSKNAVYDKIELLVAASTGTTDLSIGNVTAASLDIQSNTGSNATIPAATTLSAGLLTNAQFDKLDNITVTSPINLDTLTSNIQSNLSYTSSATDGVITNSDGSGFIIPAATSVADTNIAGLLTPTQFDKLDLISIVTDPVDLNALSSDLNTLSGDLTTLSTGVSTITGRVDTLETDVSAITSNVSTDLGIGTHNDISLQITSSDGDNATIPLATATSPGTNLAGLLSPTQFDKLDNITVASPVNLDTLSSTVGGITSNISTDLGIGTHNATSLQITSSDGNNVTLPAADTNLAGLLTNAQFDKLGNITVASPVNLNTLTSTVDGITSNIQSNLSYTSSATDGVITNSDGSGFIIPLATAVEDTNIAGLLSPTQFNKLNLISIVTDSVDLNALSTTVDGITSNVSTDLGIGAHNATSLQITSSDGNDVTLPAATASTGTNLAGLLSPTQFDKLDLISVTNTIDLDNIVGSGDITTDDAWLDPGDLIVGSGENTATILPRGNANYLYTTDVGDVEWRSAINGIGKNGTIPFSSRSSINLIEGTNISLGFADNPLADSVDVTISATGGGVTDLGIGTHNDVSLQITSSDGNDATLPLATAATGTNLAGLLSPTQFDKLGNITVTGPIDLDNLPTGSGDMLKADYDPNNTAEDIYDIRWMVEHTDPLATPNRIFTKLERDKVNNLWVGINELAATVAPVVTNDSSQGYSVGSLWIDITSGEVYRCVDNTVGAAVWAETSLSGLAPVATSGSATDLTVGTLSIDRIGDLSITSGKLDGTITTSLEKADTALQLASIGINVQGWSSVLSATTASFLVADKDKLDNIIFDDPRDPDIPINLDTLLSNVTTNNSKVSADGSVTTHSDINDAGSGSIITLNEREKLSLIAFNAGQTAPDDTINLTDLASAVAVNTTKVSNIPSNLSYTSSAIQGVIVNSDGNDAVIPLATASTGTNIAGLLTPTQFDKLGNITINQAVDLDDLETRVNNIDASVVLKGIWDPNSGSFPASTLAGFSYIVEADGTVDNITFNVNDRLIALVDAASTTTYSPDWYKADYTDQVLSVNSLTGTVVLNTDNISDAGTNKYVTADDVTKLFNITVTSPINLDTLLSNVTVNNDKVSNVSTDLSYTPSAIQGVIVSSDGNNAIIPAADTSNAGLLSPAQFDKLGNITVASPVNLNDVIAAQIINNSKEGNATHTGEVTGNLDLTLQPTAISNRGTVTALANNDFILIGDTDDNSSLKKTTAQSIADLATQTPGLNTDVQTITSSANAVSFDTSNGCNARIILTEDVLSLAITKGGGALDNGDTGIIFIKQNNTGGHTFAVSTPSTIRVYSGDLAKIPDITINSVGSATIGYAFDSGELHLYVSETT